VGPARLTKALAIDKNLNGLPLGKKSGLWVEDRGVIIAPRAIARTGRIGVEYSGIWAQKPWRFVLRR
jgi:DNA-3-methyladenine glycosylase